MTAALLTSLFLLALAVSLGLQLWLARRQLRHVLAHRSVVPAHFASRITLAAHHKAADYTVARTRVAVVELLLDAVVLLALTLGGGLALIAGWIVAVPVAALAQDVALIVFVAILGGALALPLAWYRTFVIEERFGFNRMTLRLWIADIIKGALIGAALGIPLVTLVLWLMARAGTLWWLYAWLAWVAFQVLVLALYPTLIAPLFNKFEPLTNELVRERVLRLLARCGFAARGLYVMDGSKRSAHGNAYFTGFGAARRIVLFDTLISRLAPEEIEAVLAHELGHYRRHHVWKRMALLFGLSLALLWGLGRLVGEAWFYDGLGVASRGTAGALLLFVLVLPVFTLFLQPVSSLYSRRHEFEADAYAADHSDAAELVKALVKLYQDNAATLTPDPLHSAFYDSHPPAAIRIARLRTA